MGISYEAYLIGFRIFLGCFAFFLGLLGILSTYYGIINILRLHNSGNFYHRNRFIQMQVVATGIPFSAGGLVLVHAILVPQIDKNYGVFLFFWMCYRSSQFILIVGGALYAWMITTEKRYATDHPSRLRKTSLQGSKGASNASLGQTRSHAQSSESKNSVEPEP